MTVETGFQWHLVINHIKYATWFLTQVMLRPMMTHSAMCCMPWLQQQHRMAYHDDPICCRRAQCFRADFFNPE
jgi:hypothetical protein